MNENKMRSFKSRVSKVIVSMLLLILALVGVGDTANAWWAPGTGQPPTESGWGYYYYAQSRPGSPAWDDFSYANRNISLSYYFDNFISGQGANGESLYQTCKKSDYIFWYGNQSTRQMYAQAGSLRNMWKTARQNFRFSGLDPDSAQKFISFANSSRFTDTTIVVCSGAVPGWEDKPEITIKADSATRKYNGSIQSVSGYSHTKGDLTQGHQIRANAGASRREPGSSPATFSSARIVDSKGNTVTGQYEKLTRINGKLTVTPPTLVPNENERCVDYKTDSATSIVNRRVSGSHGYAPGSVLFNPSIGSELTKGGKVVRDEGVPRVGDSYNKWTSWKSRFTQTDNITPELDLIGNGVSKAMSRHGGVYNVVETESFERYDMTHCQPQKSVTKVEWVKSKDEDGGETLTPKETVSWVNDGGRVIDKITSTPSKYDNHMSYQNLVVNCNKEELDNVINELSNAGLLKKEDSVGDRTASGFIETKKVPGVTSGNLGRYGRTATDGFYTDGTSCKEALACSSDKLTGGNNDAINNRETAPKFTGVDEIGEHGEPNESGELVFFRDNKDRMVRADLWYPKLSRSGVSDIDANVGSAPIRTKAKIYSGTPELKITTIAPWDGGNEVVKDNDIMRANEKDWSGEVNKFTMKSQWASDENNPYQLGVNWRYKVTMKNRTPSKVSADGVVETTSYEEKDVSAVCEFKNNNGSDSPSIPNTPFATPSGANDVFTESDAIRTLFNRSTSREGQTSEGN